MVPNMSDIASPLNIGSKMITKAPMITAAAVRSIGLVLITPASTTAT